MDVHVNRVDVAEHRQEAVSREKLADVRLHLTSPHSPAGSYKAVSEARSYGASLDLVHNGSDDLSRTC